MIVALAAVALLALALRGASSPRSSAGASERGGLGVTQAQAQRVLARWWS